MPPVDSPGSTELEQRRGEELAGITNGIVRLFTEYYGRGPTRAKTYLLDEVYVVAVLRDSMTTVERTLVENGHQDQIREVRLTFQEAMADAFKGVVEQALGRRVVSYHSQLLTDADIGFELFVLET
jgi:uncharacterized protein YbcI